VRRYVSMSFGSIEGLSAMRRNQAQRRSRAAERRDGGRRGLGDDSEGMATRTLITASWIIAMVC
jgi:hypothetical protein